MITLKNKKYIVDKYYEDIEEKYCCKSIDELLGKKYFIAEKFGIGNFSRMKIEDGLEISKINVDYKMEMDFNNINFSDDILELGYCYNGDVGISSLPDNKKYKIKAGDIFIYKTLNNVNYFKFEYSQCRTISVHMNFNAIKNAVNPIWEDKLIIEWQEKIKDIFEKDILIMEKASFNMKKIAEQIDSISISNMMGYINLKLKTIEFLATLLEEKSNTKFLKNSKEQEKEIIIKAKDIISKNLQNTPSVKEIASDSNISLYKLQELFKNMLGDTVYEYIKKARIEKAKELLKNTDMSILEIANEIGYENPSKFSNLFKGYNNITPLKYRKLNMSK